MKTLHDIVYVTSVSIDNGWGDSVVVLIGANHRIINRVFSTRVAHKLDDYDIKILAYSGSEWR